jgi:predicted chitinase
VTQAPAQAQLQPKAAMTQPAAQQAPAAAQVKAPAATQVKAPAAPPAAVGDATAGSKLLADPEAQVLIKVAQAAGMKGQELAQFLAQCAHETANFSSLKEFGGGLDFRKYDIKFNPKKAKTLGNTQAGDGSKYKGRGFIQLTGKGNYKRAGDALGLPLVAQPDLLERPDVAAKVAVWYWNDRVVPKVTNFADTASATKPINGGTNGLSDRTNKYADIMALMQQPRRA